jgi:aspartate kinase
MGARTSFEEGVSKVSIVGTGMRTHTGVAERMFAALAEADINMKMVTTGDIKISVLVDKNDGVKALRVVHQAFHLEKEKVSGPFFQKKGPDTFFATEEADLYTQLASMEDMVVSDVVLDMDQGRITIFNLPDRPGNCSRVFHAVAAAGIVVDMIVQNPSDPGQAQISFSVPIHDLQKAWAVTKDVVHAIDSQSAAQADPDIARLIVSGIGMRTHTGVARRMFGALAERGINIAMINTSEIRVSVVVDRAKGQEALEALKAAFGLT